MNRPEASETSLIATFAARSTSEAGPGSAPMRLARSTPSHEPTSHPHPHLALPLSESSGRRGRVSIGMTIAATNMWAHARATFVLAAVAPAPIGTIREIAVRPTATFLNWLAG